MLIDSIKVATGSEISNVHVESGTQFPVSPLQGRMYYLTSVYGAYDPGLYTFDGTNWVTGDVSEIIVGSGLIGGGSSGTITISIDNNIIATKAGLSSHAGNETLHLTAEQNTLLDNIDYVNVTANEINYLSNVSSDVQTQLNTNESGLTNHISDDTLHLTAEQNTLLDNIDYVNVTATRINYLSGLTSNIQSQIDTVTTDLSSHSTDSSLHLTPVQNTFLDSIDTSTVNGTDVNALSGISDNIQDSLDSKLDLNGGTMIGPLSLFDDPTQALHATTKQYVDGIATGLDIKDSVRVATTTDITLSGLQTVDGVALAEGDRVLVKDQVNGYQNGIYNASANAWVRTDDADNQPGSEVTTGMFTFIEEGTQANSCWTLITQGTITLGTTSLTFTQFSGAADITAGTGLTKNGSEINVIGSTGRIITNADNIDLALSGVSAGAYTKVTVDAYGRATNGENPTTLSGYGITDATPISHIGSGGASHAAATQSTAGFMSASDKTALDNAAPANHNHDTQYAPLSVSYDMFTATASQTVFTFSNIVNVPGSHRLMVFVQGIKQPESVYSETSTSITLSSGVSAGTIVECYFR